MWSWNTRETSKSAPKAESGDARRRTEWGSYQQSIGCASITSQARRWRTCRERRYCGEASACSGTPVLGIDRQTLRLVLMGDSAERRSPDLDRCASGQAFKKVAVPTHDHRPINDELDISRSPWSQSDRHSRTYGHRHHDAPIAPSTNVYICRPHGMPPHCPIPQYQGRRLARPSLIPLMYRNG
jgi:hypothetical protein